MGRRVVFFMLCRDPGVAEEDLVEFRDFMRHARER